MKHVTSATNATRGINLSDHLQLLVRLIEAVPSHPQAEASPVLGQQLGFPDWLPVPLITLEEQEREAAVDDLWTTCNDSDIEGGDLVPCQMRSGPRAAK